MSEYQVSEENKEIIEEAKREVREELAIQQAEREAQKQNEKRESDEHLMNFAKSNRIVGRRKN